MAELRSKILLRVFRTKFMQDVTFLLAITLTAGFYLYEKALPLAEYISLILAVSVPIVWVWISFTSGFMRRRAYLIFTLTYWILPQFIVIRFQDVTIGDYSTALHISSRVSGLLVRAPLAAVSDFFNIDAFITGMFLLLLCGLAFLSGYIYRDKCATRHWYRLFRERYEI
jgi:hypothetical protein